MAECGGLLSCGIASQRSYGATCNQTFMLADIDSKVITHKVMPSDTLQGLAIKYSISVSIFELLFLFNCIFLDNIYMNLMI